MVEVFTSPLIQKKLKAHIHKLLFDRLYISSVRCAVRAYWALVRLGSLHLLRIGMYSREHIMGALWEDSNPGDCKKSNCGELSPENIE
jgi:hypothetical protein